MNDDGVALNNTDYPVPPWYRRVFDSLRRPRLSKQAMEEMYITLSAEKFCHYCANHQDDTELLLHHNGVHVCNGCVYWLATIVNREFWAVHYEQYKGFAP
jgi:hypothetical protein